MKTHYERDFKLENECREVIRDIVDKYRTGDDARDLFWGYDHLIESMIGYAKDHGIDPVAYVKSIEERFAGEPTVEERERAELKYFREKGATFFADKSRRLNRYIELEKKYSGNGI